MTTRAKPMTAADLLRLSGKGVRGELIQGAFHETMSAGGIHARIVMKLGFLLMAFILPRRLGTVFGSDMGVWLERAPDTVREPDVAFYSAERMPLNETPLGYPEIAPDIVAEVSSPGDSARYIREKALMWLSYGVRLVWAVHPDTQTVDVYTIDGAVSTLGDGDALDGGDVLPGFACSVSEIFSF